MKLCSYVADGRSSYGVVHAGGGIVDLGSRLGQVYPTLLAMLKADALQAAREVQAEHAPDFDDTQVELLPLFQEQVSIHCVGLNYAAHTAEAGMQQPDFPRTFVKVRPSLVGHGQSYEMPTLSPQFDFEGELAVVIGRTARRVSRAEALNHVAGYTCFMDGSVRDYQLQRTIDQGKNFFHASAMGPWLVTPDEVGPLDRLSLATSVNGVEMQRTTFDKMIFPVPLLVHYLSEITELQPGDVIATGTPEGVGFKRTPPVFLKRGDSVEVFVERVGTLRNSVR